MYTVAELRTIAQIVADTYSKKANKMFGTCLPVPAKLHFNLQNTKPLATGTASPGTYQLNLNMILYQEVDGGVEEILNETIPHEVAHLVVLYKFKGQTVKDHGVEWKYVMKQFGKKPDRYHKLDVSKSVEYHKKLKKKLKLPKLPAHLRKA